MTKSELETLLKIQHVLEGTQRDSGDVQKHVMVLVSRLILDVRARRLAALLTMPENRVGEDMARGEC